MVASCWLFLYEMGYDFLIQGRVNPTRGVIILRHDQADGPLPFTAEAHNRSQASPCGICGKRSDSEAYYFFECFRVSIQMLLPHSMVYFFFCGVAVHPPTPQ